MRTDPIPGGLIEHAARILAHAPTRCMSAAPLHERACRETGFDVPYSRFVDVLAQDGQFTVLAGLVDDLEATCWQDAERADYAAALGGAGVPLVMLAAAPSDVHGGTGLPSQLAAACARPRRAARRTPVTLPAPSLAVIMGEVHDALADLLRGSSDLALQQAVGAAAAELHALRDALHEGPQAPPPS